MNGHGTAPGKRLLLVDDEALIVATISAGLRHAGFEVTGTRSAMEAIELARTGGYALAIVDYAMPGLNGIEAAARLSQLRQPFMFLSAYSDQELVERAILAGALAYVVKPVDPAELVPAVRTAVHRGWEISALLEQTERLTAAIETSREVSVAVGLLMAHRGISRQGAYETLRQHARRQRQRLAEVAGKIVEGVEALYAIPPPDTLQPVDKPAAGGDGETP
jgi:response regulator NasT